MQGFIICEQWKTTHAMYKALTDTCPLCIHYPHLCETFTDHISKNLIE